MNNINLRKLPLFDQSAGPSKRDWNNQNASTHQTVTCQLCGKHHQAPAKNQESWVLGRLLGIEFVEQCCGGAIDRIYKEFGEEITMAYLQELIANPEDPKFDPIKKLLMEAMGSLREFSIQQQSETVAASQFKHTEPSLRSGKSTRFE